ncbi:hypothetical protein ARAF_0536 [Arsenophonus endosymbiont of Aleurodicus floccissimus]|nr:hypothetical protein ARAF_0536 [Arsenophonus endosymbiont of Aleurodicus floccissimus]
MICNQHLLKGVDKNIQSINQTPILICGVGLGGFWAERIRFLCNITQLMMNYNLFPYENIIGKITRLEEYLDIMTKCVDNFRQKNKHNCMLILSRHDELIDSQISANILKDYYPIIWDEKQNHKFKDLSCHLTKIKLFYYYILCSNNVISLFKKYNLLSFKMIVVIKITA